MLGPTVALLVTQVVHGAVPVDENKPESESVLGFYVGLLLLALTVAALVGLVQRRPYGPRVAAWTGSAVAVGFVAYHAVPWSSAVSNPYLGEPVGAPAWLSVIAAVAAGLWCAWTGLAVAVGFVSYHAVPWSSAVSNPYLGEPVGAPAWLSVILAVGAGAWCAWTGRDVLRRSPTPSSVA